MGALPRMHDITELGRSDMCGLHDIKIVGPMPAHGGNLQLDEHWFVHSFFRGRSYVAVAQRLSPRGNLALRTRDGAKESAGEVLLLVTLQSRARRSRIGGQV
jgi:hypothetical protein